MVSPEGTNFFQGQKLNRRFCYGVEREFAKEIGEKCKLVGFLKGMPDNRRKPISYVAY